MQSYYSDYIAPEEPKAPLENDFDEIMKKMTKLPKRDYGDLFEGKPLTSYLTVQLTDKVVSKLREEFVSWSDVRVSTAREMMDLGIPSEVVWDIKTTLNAAYRTGGRNIEALTLDELASLEIKEEDGII